MTRLNDRLQELSRVKRHRHHPLVHEIHHEHHISRKTLFYVKEYGSRSHAAQTIVHESLKILLLASVISSVGGFALENIKQLFIALSPLVILLPALNDFIGDFGTILSGHVSTLLHEGKLGQKWWSNPELKKLFLQMLVIAIVMGGLASLAALILSGAITGTFSTGIALRVLLISLLDVVLIVILLFVLSVVLGIYFYEKGEDPNNFLIPITTSVADFGNMLLLAGLVLLFF